MSGIHAVLDTSSDMLSSVEHLPFTQTAIACKAEHSTSNSGAVTSIAHRLYLNTTMDDKQQLLDRVEELLKKINFNNELIATYDDFFENQSGTAKELRTELEGIRLSDNSPSISPTIAAATWDYHSIFKQSENSPEHTDIPPSTEVSEEFSLSNNKKNCRYGPSEVELFSYLVEREREILRLQNYITNNCTKIDTWDLSNLFSTSEDQYVTRYWELWNQNKKLKQILSEIQAKEQSLVDQLQEQEQLTVFYAYLNHSSERESKEFELTEDSTPESE